MVGLNTKYKPDDPKTKKEFYDILRRISVIEERINKELKNITVTSDGGTATNIELRATSTYIQWKYETETEWTDLIALADLKGTDGVNGIGVPIGGTLGQVLKKISATDYDTEWANESGASILNDLTDVNILSPSDGQALVYDSGTSKWIPQTLSGSAGTSFYNPSTLVALVAISSPNTGDWAYVDLTGFYYVYLDGYWQRLGTMSPVVSGYGETVHYDASAIQGKSDGQAVFQWDDISGNGYYAQAVDTGPIYKTNIINGYPVLRFTEVDDSTIMQIPGKAFGNVSGDKLTALVVMKPNTSNYNPLLSVFPSGGPGWIYRYKVNNTTISYIHFGYVEGTYSATNQFNVLWFRRNADNNIEAGVNGNTDQLSASPTGFSPTTETHTQIGSYSNGGDPLHRLDGDIAEILIFEDAISDTLLGTVISDMKTKYGIT